MPEPAERVLHLASFSREGYLRLFPTTTPDWGDLARKARGQWPEAGHDAHNSGNYHTDARRPTPISNPIAVSRGNNVFLMMNAARDEHDTFWQLRYEVRSVPGTSSSPSWSEASTVPFTPIRLNDGRRQLLFLRDLAPGNHTFLVRAYDRAGNGSAPVAIEVDR